MWPRHGRSSGIELVVFGMSTRVWLDQATPLCNHGQRLCTTHGHSWNFATGGTRIYKELMVATNTSSPPPLITLPLAHLIAMCYYQPIIFECPACHGVAGRGVKDKECRDYIQTRDREMGRMQKWREGSRERAPPTPFIFGWCRKNGRAERDPVTVVSDKPCETCTDAGWSGESNLPSPSGSETNAGFAHDRYRSPEVQAPPSPPTSIEDDLDDDKIELDFTPDAPSK